MIRELIWVAAALFVLIAVTGRILSRKGKPYDAALFNVHKLISLAFLALLAVISVRTGRASPFSSPEAAGLVLAGLFFVGAVITGGLANIAVPAGETARRLHRVLVYLALLGSAGAVVLLWIR